MIEARALASKPDQMAPQQHPDEELGAQSKSISDQSPDTEESPEVASAEPEGDKPADDAASKAKQRLERFKALQARAVSLSLYSRAFVTNYSQQTIEERCEKQPQRNGRRVPASSHRLYSFKLTFSKTRSGIP